MDEILTTMRERLDDRAESIDKLLPGFARLRIPEDASAKLPNIGQPFGLYLGVYRHQSTDYMLHSVACLDHVNRSKQLWLVDLSGWTLLNRTTMEQLAGQKSIRYLVLDSTNTSDEFLQILSSLPELQSLEMNDCNDARRSYSRTDESKRLSRIRLSSAGIGALAKIATLRNLSLQQCDLTDEALTKLGEFQHLQLLNLAFNRALTDGCLTQLFKLKQLQQLDLSYCTNLTPSGVQGISALSQLKALKIAKINLNAQVLSEVARIESLRGLSLAYCTGVTAEGIRSLQKLTQLKYLDLSGTNLTDDDLQAVAELKHLEGLRLSSNKGIRTGFAQLSKLAGLCDLTINDTSVDDSGLRAIAELKSLENLQISSCRKLTDVGMTELSKLPKLKCVGIDSSGLTSAGLKELAKSSTLERISARTCKKISDDGVKELGRLPSLKYLDLFFCPGVSAAAFDDPERFKSLRHLILAYCGSADVEKVARTLPDCQVAALGESSTTPEPNGSPTTKQTGEFSPRNWVPLAIVALTMLALLAILVRRWSNRSASAHD